MNQKKQESKKLQVAKEVSIYKPFPKPALNNTTIKYLDQQNTAKTVQPIRVDPSEVIFQDIEVGRGEETSVYIKNVTKKMKRIKIKPPITNKFFCDCKNPGPLAAGLSMELIVSFKTNEEGGNYSDEILIIPEGESPIRLPLIAFAKAWHVVYPPFLNFGFLQPSKPGKRQLYFSNEGDNVASVSLSATGNDAAIGIEEPNFEIQPGEKKAVTVSLTAQSTGELVSKSISVTIGGEQREPISLNAVVVRQVLSVVFENGAGQASEINFGSLFFGESRECNAVLVNNGPKSMPFNITFTNESNRDREGDNYEDKFKPPMKVGIEMIEREMSAIPLSGTVEAYSELPIKFICRTKKSPKFHIMDYIPKREDGYKSLDPDLDKASTDYYFVAHLQYDENQDTPIVMKARACVPRVSVKTSLQFGECAVNERLDTLLRIENNTEDLIVPFEFAKVAHFKTDPVRDRLHPMSDRTILVTFLPKNMGVFSTMLILKLVNGIYEVPIKLNGIARKIGQKTKLLRGPEATKKDFVEEPKYFQEDKAQKQADRMKVGESSIPPWLKETTTWQVDQDIKGGLTEGISQTKMAAMKSNTFLREERIRREQRALKETKMKRMAKKFPQSLEDYLNDVDLNLEQGRPSSPKLGLNVTNDPLWVVKAVGMHEPSAIESKRNIEFDSHRPLRKQPYDPLPKGEEQSANCSTELTGNDLQKIAAGPITIDFGNLFVNSEEVRYFNVSNDLHQFILVKFLDVKDTIQIIPEQQVIPGSAVASFMLKFKSATPQEYNRALPYKVNDKHIFNICTKAKVEPVKLEVSPSILNFQMNSDNLDRSMESYLRIVNPGNWIAKYNIDLVQQNQAFKMQTGQFTIDKKETKQFKVTYTPTEDTQAEEAKIIISIMDGEKLEIICRGTCPKGDCELVDKADIDFGEVQVGAAESEEKYIKIKNKQTKESAIVHVDISAIPELKLKSPTPLRMHSNEEASVALALMCAEQKQVEGDVLLYVRGGKTLTAKVKANVIVPEVAIEEEVFDFGLITSQGPKTMPITFVNKSNIQAMLVMNLEGERELSIMRPPGQNEKEGVLEPIVDQKKEPSKDNIDVEVSEEEEENLGLSEEVEQFRKYKIGVPPNSKFVLWLKFTPDITIHDKRKIPLPIEIKGVGKTNDIRRDILVETKQPKISLDPVKLEFEDKVVTGKPYHTAKDLILMNLQVSESLKWLIKKEEVEDDGVWQINPYDGVMEPGGTMTLRVMFNPQAHKEYVRKVPLYVGDSIDVPYLEFEMRGRGTTPKLAYDKNEIIIPPAPLKVESKAVFRVRNQGYENLDLSKYKIKFMDYPPDPIPVELQFPEKTKAVNISKKELRIEAVFKSNKPINMTAKIEFQDDLINQPDTIDISAVADNCVLTTYSYILRWRDEITFVVNNGTVELKYECPDSDDEGDTLKDKNEKGLSKAGSTVSKTSRKALTMIGYTPIQPELRRKACDYIKRWLNSNALTTTVQHFPQDFIKDHGRQLYELLYFLTGKNFNPPAQPPQTSNQSQQNTSKEDDSDELARSKYEWLLTELTKYGAMLNTIRPEHLLSEEEYKRICKKFKFASGDAGLRFSHLSEEAWITVFYQILKIFYLRRVNLATFKATSMIPANEKVLPSTNSSNVYSDSELLLLKWLEYHYNQQNQYQHKTLTNFESDLQDSLVFVAVIKSYCKSVKGLTNMRTVSKTKDDLRSNAQKVIYTLKTELQLKTHIVEEDILDPSAREMIIFCTQLFLYLPHYIPSDTIVFECTLSQTVTKTIELKNDNKDRISYFVQLEGSSDFSIGDKKYISIEPGKVESFPVTFISRISKPVEAILMFNNHGDGPKQAAPLVFRLESNITKRISVEVYNQNTDTNLYEPREILIEVPNKFSKNARFTVEIKYEKRKTIEAGQKKKKGDKKAGRNQEIAEEMMKYVPEPYFCKQETLPVNRGQTQTLTVVFLPFELGVHRCFVILTDNDVGELQFEIIGNAKLPAAYGEPVTKTFPTEMRQLIEFTVPFRNTKMEGARAILQSQCTKDRKEKEKINWENYKKLMQEQQAYDVKITDTSGVFKVPNTLMVMDKSAGKKDQTSQRVDASRLASDITSEKGEDAKLQIEFFAKVVRRYEAKVMITNQAKTDVRIYDLIIKTHPPPVYGQLTFNVPARHQVIQDIPINNESDKEWTIKVDLQYDKTQPAKFDVGRFDFAAPKKQITNIPLKFTPEWVCECKGKLVINIQSTLQTFSYDLIGRGEEPLAEEKIVVNCEAKKTTKYAITLKNESDRVVQYRVETDMAKVLSGDATVKLLPREATRYMLSITPLVGGVDMGSITFIDTEERYIWYVVELHVSSPEAEEEKPMQTYVRRPIAYEFSIKNPLNESVTFDVDIRGEGLIGEPILAVPANQVRVYELVYAPLKSGTYTGSISFISEKAGEIKYKLALKADDGPAIALGFMEVELGKTGLHQVVLENPTKEEQLVISHNSNPTNYDVQEKIIIPPYTAMNVPIKYTPSNLNAIENARIVFDSKNIGRWEFTLEGRGKLPTDMKMEKVSTTVGDTIPSSIVFKNPLKEQATIEITMEPANSKEFVLLVKKSKVVLPPLSGYTIPFQFTPHSMALVKATLVVKMSDTLVWRYPLEGDAEYLSRGAPFMLKCQSRRRSQETLKIQLPDLIELKKDDVFSIEVIPKEQALTGLIDRSVVVELIKQTLEKVDEPLECLVKFEPLRPFKAQTELLFSKSTGGRWRFGAIFEATDPEIDDIIEIKSPLHKTSSVSFRLCNHTRTHAEFQAFFTHDSATEFSVYPKTGTLEPFGKEGTNFIVSFTPTEYGKHKVGKLIIQTEEMQWTYEIRGSHPEYRIPRPEGGRLDNKLSKNIESKLMHKSPTGTRKNFIKDNIKKQKDPERKMIDKSKSVMKSKMEPSASKYPK